MSTITEHDKDIRALNESWQSEIKRVKELENILTRIMESYNQRGNLLSFDINIVRKAISKYK